MLSPLSKSHAVRDFKGLREVGPEIDKRTEEVMGMYDRFKHSLHRMRGKLQMSSGVSSSIWSIAQLRFQSGSGIVWRKGELMAVNNASVLPGGTVFEMTGAGRVDNADVPQAEVTSDVDTPLNWSSEAHAQGVADIRIEPGEVTLNTTAISWSSLLKWKSDDCTLDLPAYFRIHWSENNNWLSVWYRSNGMAYPVLNGSIVLLGVWTDLVTVFELGFSADTSVVTPAPSDTDDVFVDAVYPVGDQYGLLLVNPDGNYIADNAAITGVFVQPVPLTCPWSYAGTPNQIVATHGGLLSGAYTLTKYEYYDKDDNVIGCNWVYHQDGINISVGLSLVDNDPNTGYEWSWYFNYTHQHGQAQRGPLYEQGLTPYGVYDYVPITGPYSGVVVSQSEEGDYPHTIRSAHSGQFAGTYILTEILPTLTFGWQYVGDGFTITVQTGGGLWNWTIVPTNYNSYANMVTGASPYGAYAVQSGPKVTSVVVGTP